MIKIILYHIQYHIILKHFKLIAVDCEWDEWKIGECSKTCGGGTQTNTRIKKIMEKHGGKKCSGSSSKEIKCNVQECSGRKCIYIIQLAYCNKILLANNSS